jgi:hypothetical protein
MALLEVEDDPRAVRLASDSATVWMRRAERMEADVADERYFQRLVLHLAGLARELDVAAVWGVSDIGKRLARSAAVVLGVPVWDGRAVKSLLLVDGLVNTGIQLAIAARDAERAGATRITAMAARIDQTARANLRRGGLDVEGLEVI